jgi:hypothetical protein
MIHEEKASAGWNGEIDVCTNEEVNILTAFSESETGANSCL